MFSGDEFSKTSKYFLDKNIVEIATPSQFKGSCAVEV